MTNLTPVGISNLNLPDVSGAGSGAGAGEGGFSGVLKSAIDSVNEVNDSASAQVANLVEGKGGDLNSVMMAVEKADVSFQLMMQVRNKIVSAYQSIENMQF